MNTMVIRVTGVAFALAVASALPLQAQEGARDAAAETRPDTVYDCRVETQSGSTGLVRVQAQTLDKARTMVLKSYARTYDGERSRTISVSECVMSGKQRFSDPVFQQFSDTVPR